jgi:N-acetylglucosaminyl-diphospho-decaprenol L-rhamnosyltransferase
VHDKDGPGAQGLLGQGGAGLERLASFVIVNYNGGRQLLDCISSIVRDAPSAEVIVVDNASSDGSADAALAAYPSAVLVRAGYNAGFGAGANLGARSAKNDILVFLNPDVVLEPSSTAPLVRDVLSSGGIAGPRLLNAGSSQPDLGATIDLMGLPRGLVSEAAPLYVQGCCLVTTRRCFEAVGGFDERYFLTNEDVEFCWQALRRGFPVQVVREATVHHAGGSVMRGGYQRGGTIETSTARVLLREKNTWSLFVACAPTRQLPLLLGLSVVRTVMFGALLASRGRGGEAAKLACGIGQVATRLPATLRRRCRPGVGREGEAAAWERVSKRLFVWGLLRKKAPVRFVE